MTSIIRRFFRGDDGITAVEFALVVAPFLWVLMAIMELSMAFAASTSLEGATLSASRMIKTGQAQSPPSGMTSEDVFVNSLCDEAVVFLRCQDLKYQVVLLGDNSGFSNADNITVDFDQNGDIIDANGNVGNSFNSGGISDVVLIRVIYHYEFMTPLMGMIFANNDLNAMTFISTVVLKNEPYDFEV